MEQKKSYLIFDKKMVNRIAHKSLTGGHLLNSIWKQSSTEWSLKLFKKINFRSNKNDRACDAYLKMNGSQFANINARQSWANWRTIPANLSGQIGEKPLYALDLCAGTGDSTQVLACYLPKGSKVLGLEISPRFVKIAQERQFFHQSGSRAIVEFSAQSVLETFLDVSGRPLLDASVDIVNCCGAIGFHFDFASSQKLIEEISRVLRPGGLALLDAGGSGMCLKSLTALMKAKKFSFIKFSKSCWVDIHGQACYKKS